jgi:hypothetical protein
LTFPALPLAFIVLIELNFGANAAELPSRATKPLSADQKDRACEIEGERGVALPNGGCVRISGYVSVGVSAEKPKH